MKWMMSAMAAAMLFVSTGAAYAADAPSCDAKTSPISNQGEADRRCANVCQQAGYGAWNGQWTNTPPSGGGTVCGCKAKSHDVKTGPIANQAAANQRCPGVCSSARGSWNGQWTNTPPSGGGTVCGCYKPC